jgi:lipoate-protein ligase A
MIQHTRLVTTRSQDPYHNIALEEALLEHLVPGEAILYLWQNERTVVIGAHQNPWRECRVELLESEGGRLARRLSGGGAVFHDLGNLNFTFLLAREDYDLTRQSSVILETVQRLGIPAEVSGRNDLLAAGRKFSGNAFYLRRNVAFHHGTILVQADFQRMARYLQPPAEKMRAKGVESVQARVVNLAELAPGLTIPQVSQALQDAFRHIYGEDHLAEEDGGLEGSPELAARLERFASWEWRFGRTPVFDIDWNQRFPWGGVEIGLELDKGRVRKATVYSDAMEEDFISRLAKTLDGVRYQGEAIREAVSSLPCSAAESPLHGDLLTWLGEILPI